MAAIDRRRGSMKYIGGFVFLLFFLCPSIVRSEERMEWAFLGRVEKVEEVIEQPEGFLPQAGALPGGEEKAPKRVRFHVKALGGPEKGKVIVADPERRGFPEYGVSPKEGQKVVVYGAKDPMTGSVTYLVIDYVRHGGLIGLFVIFALLLVGIGRMKGLKALGTLILSLLAIYYLYIPLLLKGYNPLIISTLLAFGIPAISIPGFMGLNRKSLSAFLGIAAGIALAIAIGVLVTRAGVVTGAEDPKDAQFILKLTGLTRFDFTILLLGAMIIGALGAIMDVGVVIASSMDEIVRRNPGIRPLELIKSARNVWRDITGMMATTLIFAYGGVMIPLLILLKAKGMTATLVLNDDWMVSELLRMFVGSLGLLLVGPFTALAGAFILTPGQPIPEAESGGNPEPRKGGMGAKSLLIILIPLILMGMEREMPGIQKRVGAEGVVVSIPPEAKRLYQQKSSWESFVSPGEVVRVRILTGKYKGQEVDAYNGIGIAIKGGWMLREGQKVALGLMEDPEKKRVERAFILSHHRSGVLKWSIISLAILFIILCDINGLKTIVSLALATILVFFVMVPAAISLKSVLLANIGLSLLILIFFTLLIGGVGKKGMTAVLGAVGGMFSGFVVAAIAGLVLKMTGTREIATSLLLSAGWPLDYPGIFYSGILIGTMGAVMDIALDISSSMAEIRRRNPDLPDEDLFKAGLEVGSDLMGAIANTLVLAYTAVCLPTLLYFMARGFQLPVFINYEVFSAELIRALVGSIGMFITIPLTAFVGMLLMPRRIV
jgi:uncharacterized membrane protein